MKPLEKRAACKHHDQEQAVGDLEVEPAIQRVAKRVDVDKRGGELRQSLLRSVICSTFKMIGLLLNSVNNQFFDIYEELERFGL